MSRVYPLDVTSDRIASGNTRPQQEESATTSLVHQSRSEYKKTSVAPPNGSSQPVSNGPPKPAVNNNQPQNNVSDKPITDFNLVLNATKKQTIVFILVLGLFMVAFGAALTWYAIHTDLQDFFILGPGSLIIGSCLVIIAIFIAIRRYMKLTRLKPATEKLTPSNVEKDNVLYDLQPCDTTALSNYTVEETDLYGRDDIQRARRANTIISKSGSVSAPITKKESMRNLPISAAVVSIYEKELGELPPPQVTLPEQVHESKEGTYNVPLVDRQTLTKTEPTDVSQTVYRSEDIIN